MARIRAGYNALVILALLSTGILYLALWSGDEMNEEGARQIALLERELANAKAEQKRLLRLIDEMESEVKREMPAYADPSKGLPLDAPANVRRTAGAGPQSSRLSGGHEEAAEFFLNQRVNAIERLVAIDEAQKRKLRERFGAEEKIRQEADMSGLKAEEIERQIQALSSVDQILGQELAAKYREKEAEARRRREDGQVDFETFKLKKALGLAPEQEELLLQIIKEARSESAAIFNPEAAHKDIGAGKMTVEQFFGLRKEKAQHERDLIDSRIKPLLTEAQMNQLMEYRANQDDSSPFRFP